MPDSSIPSNAIRITGAYYGKITTFYVWNTRGNNYAWHALGQEGEEGGGIDKAIEAARNYIKQGFQSQLSE